MSFYDFLCFGYCFYMFSYFACRSVARFVCRMSYLPFWLRPQGMASPSEVEVEPASPFAAECKCSGPFEKFHWQKAVNYKRNA